MLLPGVTANQWLQFDIGPATLVTGLVTKGRSEGQRKHWVTRYRLSYSNDSQTWHFYKHSPHLPVNVTYSAFLRHLISYTDIFVWTLQCHARPVLLSLLRRDGVGIKQAASIENHSVGSMCNSIQSGEVVF